MGGGGEEDQPDNVTIATLISKVWISIERGGERRGAEERQREKRAKRRDEKEERQKRGGYFKS